MRSSWAALLIGVGVSLAASAGCSSSSKGFAAGDGGGGSSSGSQGGSSSGTGSSSGGSSGSSSGSNSQTTAACKALATAICDKLESCAPFTSIDVPYGDTATCETRVALGCDPSVGVSGSKTTASDVMSCATAVTAASCAQWLDNAQLSACNVPGTVAKGSGCGIDSQCATGFCRLTAGSACGTCDNRAGTGGSCLSDPECQATMICNVVATDAGISGTCVAPGASGATCGKGDPPCERDLACVGGKCGTPAAVGADCPTGLECNGGQGDFCNTSTKKCAAAGTATAGNACGVVGGNLVACTGGAVCANVDGQGMGKCFQAAADGAVCGTVPCLAPAICAVSGAAKCTLPDPEMCK